MPMLTAHTPYGTFTRRTAHAYTHVIVQKYDYTAKLVDLRAALAEAERAGHGPDGPLPQPEGSLAWQASWPMGAMMRLRGTIASGWRSIGPSSCGVTGWWNSMSCRWLPMCRIVAELAACSGRCCGRIRSVRFRGLC